MRKKWFRQFGKEMGRKFQVQFGWEGKEKKTVVLFLLKEIGRKCEGI